jgi:hypothetical protein
MDCVFSPNTEGLCHLLFSASHRKQWSSPPRFINRNSGHLAIVQMYLQIPEARRKFGKLWSCHEATFWKVMSWDLPSQAPQAKQWNLAVQAALRSSKAKLMKHTKDGMGKILINLEPRQSKDTPQKWCNDETQSRKSGNNRSQNLTRRKNERKISEIGRWNLLESRKWKNL